MPAPGRPPLACSDLTVGHTPGNPVLQGLTFQVDRGQTVAIVGESGCGKTTLLETLAGILDPQDGQARVLDTNLPGRPAPGQLGYIPQSLGLVENATVLRNVLLGTLPRVGLLGSLTGRFPKEARREAETALEALGLARYARTRPRELSGGERRRVAIARTLAQGPRILLADEILSELDVTTADAVIAHLRRVQEEADLAILMVEHNLDVAWQVADRVLCLLGDRIAKDLSTTAGSAEDLREVLKDAS